MLEWTVRVAHRPKADRAARYEALVVVLAERESEAHLIAAQMVDAIRAPLGCMVIGTETVAVVA